MLYPANFWPHKNHRMLLTAFKMYRDSDAERAERLMHLGYERLTVLGDASAMAQRYLQVFREVVHGVHYPPHTFYGIYADGWIGSRAVIAYGASAEPRHLELVLTLPPGTPYPRVSAEVRHNRPASMVPRMLTCGTEELIRLELSHQESYIELLLMPTFQPRAHAMGEDMRMLGCLCRACRIVSAHGTEDLLAGRG